MQDVAIPIYMELYQNQSINESIDCYQQMSKNSHFDIDLNPRELKREYDQNIFCNKRMCEVTAKSDHK